MKTVFDIDEINKEGLNYNFTAQLVKNPPAMQETPQLDSREGKIPWRRDRLLTPVFLGFPDGSNGKEHACSAGDLGWEDPLEKGMATHSSILAWRIPWTEEPGGLHFMGSQCDWETEHSAARVYIRASQVGKESTCSPGDSGSIPGYV